MKIFNLGVPEIALIVVLALIILGPNNMVKSARDIGAFIRKVTKSPYWKEVWATRRELNEIPKILSREADLDATIKDLNRETKDLQSAVSSSMSDLIKEVEKPLKQVEKELKDVDKELKAEPVISVEIPVPPPETSEIKNDQKNEPVATNDAPDPSLDTGENNQK